MALTNVWLQTIGDGLVRGDQVVGIEVHQTPALTGKAAHWLLDVVLPASTGSGARGDWDLTALHRTLVQASQPPGDAPAMLARLLAQLDAVNAAGVITTGAGSRGNARTRTRWPRTPGTSGSASSRSPARRRGTTRVPSTCETSPPHAQPLAGR